MPTHVVQRPMFQTFHEPMQADRSPRLQLLQPFPNGSSHTAVVPQWQWRLKSGDREYWCRQHVRFRAGNACRYRYRRSHGSAHVTCRVSRLMRLVSPTRKQRKSTSIQAISAWRLDGRSQICETTMRPPLKTSSFLTKISPWVRLETTIYSLRRENLMFREIRTPYKSPTDHADRGESVQAQQACFSCIEMPTASRGPPAAGAISPKLRLSRRIWGILNC